jgi:murein L,D-transpeptidase YcbB/YkuD
VYFVYLTAWAEGGGVAEFRPDIYGRDGHELSSDREHDPDAPPPPPQSLAP